MPRGRGKGGNKRKKAKNLGIGEKRELIFKEDGQEYAQVLRMLGNGRLDAFCFDGVKRMCTIRGTLKNRGDIILVGLREFGDDKGDVILKYYDEEAKELKELGEIPEHIKINEGDFGFEEDGFQYVDGEEEKEEDDLDIDTI
ncbi:eukaryotic translation initiation factor x-chromosomal-like [Stylonychia lemnae]|uniref:Eukaryotic translation initiation factor x-chromosomal-like n=1 Tax=Stylonychia lemnae TaxID=5949 RepID=A0A078B9G3_STYLE|nr:eukaryotic translation initiation factor x-chromosomal-like [Stylonychia lemnae]|eukprot:CDW91049.1 eukaryotic translation initiation factor x-chromosomal-like [Stylonychia lemnae]